jgi:hypothetical protein
VPEPWRKLGRVLEAAGTSLSRTHVMLPTPRVMSDRVRVFYASCDAEIRGRIFFADFEREPPFALMAVSPDPVFDVGPARAFDCDGANPSQLIEAEGRLGLLYIGWRRGPADAPYTLFAGLAFSGDGGLSFERQAEPLLPPREGERLFRTAAFLDRDAQGYRLLYIGGDRFVTGEGGRMTPVYSLMELRSDSPWLWPGAGKVLMAPDVAAGEVGFGRPVIVRRGTQERLMISLRTRAGYQLMESDLPANPAGRPALTPVIPGPVEAWEAEMTCFGAPCAVGANELLFYNGNGYGSSGLGLAWRPLS